jgi:hypothetical protein
MEIVDLVMFDCASRILMFQCRSPVYVFHRENIQREIPNLTPTPLRIIKLYHL